MKYKDVMSVKYSQAIVMLKRLYLIGIKINKQKRYKMTKIKIINTMRAIYKNGDNGYRIDHADYTKIQMDKAEDLFDRLCHYALYNRIP